MLLPNYDRRNFLNFSHVDCVWHNVYTCLIKYRQSVQFAEDYLSHFHYNKPSALVLHISPYNKQTCVCVWMLLKYLSLKLIFDFFNSDKHSFLSKNLAFPFNQIRDLFPLPPPTYVYFSKEKHLTKNYLSHQIPMSDTELFCLLQICLWHPWKTK